MKSQNNPVHIKEVLVHLSSVTGDIPTHRRASRRVYAFSGLPFTLQLAIWDELWHSQNNFWIRLHAFFFLERHVNKSAELREMWPVVVHWQKQVDDWGLCDALAKVYTKILEVMPGEVYEQLSQWNRSESLWMRRQSVVSLLYYSRTKKQYLAFGQIKQLIENLLTDHEYYVQKGIGWALRELYTVYPEKTLGWLKRRISKISSIAFTTCIEKMDAVTKAQLKSIRKLK